MKLFQKLQVLLAAGVATAGGVMAQQKPVTDPYDPATRAKLDACSSERSAAMMGINNELSHSPHDPRDPLDSDLQQKANDALAKEDDCRAEALGLPKPERKQKEPEPVTPAPKIEKKKAPVKKDPKAPILKATHQR